MYKCMKCCKSIESLVDKSLKKQIVKCPICGNYHEVTLTKDKVRIKNLESNKRVGF